MRLRIFRYICLDLHLTVDDTEHSLLGNKQWLPHEVFDELKLQFDFWSLTAGSKIFCILSSYTLAHDECCGRDDVVNLHLEFTLARTRGLDLQHHDFASNDFLTSDMVDRTDQREASLETLRK
jgi:hypothetical protein